MFQSQSHALLDLHIAIDHQGHFRLNHRILCNHRIIQFLRIPRPSPQVHSLLRSVLLTEQQVILFNPKSFDEAGDLVQHLTQGRSIVMTLEGVPTDLARRLLDFLSGIAYALQGKITPISAKTYFVTPQNVDVLGAEEFGSSGSGTAST